MTKRVARKKIAHFTRLMYTRGYVVATEGNISMRISEKRILITASKVLKGDFSFRDVVEIDLDGKLISGKKKPTSERFSHLQIYKERPDVKAIVHAHPIHAVLLTALGVDAFSSPVLSESAMFLPKVAMLPFACPSTKEGAGVIIGRISDASAFLIERHGSFTYADSPETAFSLLEILEKTARAEFLAQISGKNFPRLSNKQIEDLMKVEY